MYVAGDYSVARGACREAIAHLARVNLLPAEGIVVGPHDGGDCAGECWSFLCDAAV